MAVPSSGQLRLNADINLEINGTGTGTDVSLNGLSTSAGFSAPNGMEEFYGYVDAVAPSVSTNASTSVTSSSMTANGNVTSDGGGTITQRGFYFGTSSNYANNTKYTVSGTTGSFAKGFGGLSSQTTYYATAYAINSIGETRGVTRSAATTYNYQLRSIFINSNQQGGYPITSFNIKSYYQALNGSYTLHNTQYSSNGFLITGLNGRGYLVGSRIRTNRMVFEVTGATSCSYSRTTYFNWYNSIVNTAYQFGGTSKTYTSCNYTPGWNGGSYMYMNNYAGIAGQSLTGTYTITAG